MRARLLMLLMAVVLLAQTQFDGPYAFKDGWTCYRPETNEATKSVHCDCKLACENGGSEDSHCQTYCAPKSSERPKCRCHGDESCDAPEVLPAPHR